MATRKTPIQMFPANRTCPLCSRRFTRSYNLRSHLRTHSNERPFKCSVCNKAFTRQHDRKRHERLHLGERRFVCRGALELGGEWGCGRAFSRVDALARHLRSNLGSECIRPLLHQEREQNRRRTSPNATMSTAPAITIVQPIGYDESFAAAATPTDLDSNITFPYFETGIGWTSMVPVSAALAPQYPTLATVSWSSSRSVDPALMPNTLYFDLAGESPITNVFEPRKGPVRCCNCQNIGHKSFQCKYAQNRRKREPVRQSLMNDVELKDYGVLAVSEPYARLVDGRVVTSPMWHSNWTTMIPTQKHDGPWPIRSMLWVRSDIEAEQLPIPSADLTAAVLRLPERDVLVVSVRTDVVLIGDFNRHHLLWTGDDVSAMRQGEAEPIINLMNEHGLCSLLPRGTRTWQGQDQESTIDLVLATSELADTMVTCVPHPTDHGSDHRAIQTTFDVELPERVATPRLLFKNAPWNLIRARVEEGLRALLRAADVQAQADQLMGVVLEAIYDLTPRAQPSPYSKRWWSGDLTRLRRAFTFWRNQARTQRRAGQACSDLERRAKEAAKEYHDAMRRQRKAHWEDFLAEDSSIWKAAKYLEPGKDAMGDKVPPLKKAGGTMTRNRAEQVEQLLDTFFPPPPARIEEEGLRPQRRAVAMPALTLEEVEVKVMAAKPWKAAGTDGLPAMASLRDGVVPDQWRTAKIIPLKKPEKGDYTVRPISLLPTLGKILEAVVAERISYVVETYGLLPANHFGARKRRSAEQGLLLLQEQIYKAWRARKVLSLISFDVKGAYNAGLPQGSPLSPVLFLFFNADLVQRRIKAAGGSIAFIDDYSAWVTGRTAEANRAGIQVIIDAATDWEKRSGATFEVDKTTIVHFTRGTARNDGSFWIKGTEVKPKASAKILGVIMDSGLRYQEHMARAAQKGVTAAMNLRRLKLLSPRVARQLFLATVAPAMDYASNVWMRARRAKETGWLNKAQRIGAQAITGSFQTVATAVAEAEAGIRAVGERHEQAATRLCVDLRTLPLTHPLAALKNKASKRYLSPMQGIAALVAKGSTERMEVINEYALRPWTDRIPLLGEDDPEGAQKPYDVQNILIATAASQRNDVVGMGGVVCDTTLGGMGHTLATFSVTIGPGSEQNPYTAELEAVATALRSIPPSLVAQDVTIAVGNRSVVAAIRRPQQQSGRCTISGIYDQMKRLQKRGCTVRLMWVPAGEEEFAPRQLAKAAAKRATERGCEAEVPWYQARTTTLRLPLARGRARERLPESVGKYSKRI
ncbi:reverse transcriptase [Purpureocillium lavendulum]|uniref:Reverse transcriptase n=1 Tax=Purpureocillium lavendulum TaxID=1247861 RepID=A0AB34FD74_9HYPO|nr:reverse transcriptase [Purpureocillium lavendulum]